MEFYNDLAADYDEMISFANRLPEQIKIFKELLRIYPAETILDAGCGSGFHSIALSLAGHSVTGIDISDKMLAQAKKNAEQYDADIRFYRSSLSDIRIPGTENFDAVFCLGNTFVHLPDDQARKKALFTFISRLAANGYVFIEILNYDKILKNRPRQISEKKVGDSIYLRSYDYLEKAIRFNLEIIKNASKHKISIMLYPIRSYEFLDLISSVGVNKYDVFGSQKLEAFDPEKSNNLVVLLNP